MFVQKEKTLQRVLFDLKPEWEEELALLKENLAGEGVVCAVLPRTVPEASDDWRMHTAVLTDSARTGRKLAREGIVYFGCFQGNQDTDSDNGWFDGAALVLEGFEEVDARYLEEWMLRAQGLPAEIARTGRLLIREMTQEDIPELVRIGREGRGSGMEIPVSNPYDSTVSAAYPSERYSAAAVFSEERLQAYIQTAYRLQGFGLWSVLYEDRVIGCCGFAPCGDLRGYTHQMTLNQTDICRMDENQMKEQPKAGHDRSPAVEKRILEMQYMVDAAYRRQGFGTEMCRAALDYARERLGVDEVRLRIREDNRASQALAGKLGFDKKSVFSDIRTE